MLKNHHRFFISQSKTEREIYLANLSVCKYLNSMEINLSIIYDLRFSSYVYLTEF